MLASFAVLSFLPTGHAAQLQPGSGRLGSSAEEISWLSPTVPSVQQKSSRWQRRKWFGGLEVLLEHAAKRLNSAFFLSPQSLPQGRPRL